MCVYIQLFHGPGPPLFRQKDKILKTKKNLEKQTILKKILKTFRGPLLFGETKNSGKKNLSLRQRRYPVWCSVTSGYVNWSRQSPWAELNMHIWLSCCNMPWKKLLRRFWQPTRTSQISRITVSVFLCSLKLTALLLKISTSASIVTPYSIWSHTCNDHDSDIF